MRQPRRPDVGDAGRGMLSRPQGSMVAVVSKRLERGCKSICANLASTMCCKARVNRHVGRDSLTRSNGCRHPEHRDVLVALAIPGFWIPAIPAGMTYFSLSWRVWVANPVPRGGFLVARNGGIGNARPARSGSRLIDFRLHSASPNNG